MLNNAHLQPLCSLSNGLCWHGNASQMSRWCRDCSVLPYKSHVSSLLQLFTASIAVICPFSCTVASLIHSLSNKLPFICPAHSVSCQCLQKDARSKNAIPTPHLTFPFNFHPVKCWRKYRSQLPFHHAKVHRTVRSFSPKAKGKGFCPHSWSHEPGFLSPNLRV